MGFVDKVKGAARDVAAGARKGTAQVQAKIEQAQIRKKADEAAKRLGYLIVRERRDGTPAGEEADRLVSEITALEAQLGSEAQTEPPAETPPAPPLSASEPQPGDFKLE